MGDGRARMVVCDMTGKSVSGALVMSFSRSVFRMLSEEELTVSGSMMHANRRLKKDVKTAMFEALLFAVLNSQDRTLTLRSAGQTQPVLIMPAKTPEAKLVETERDTLLWGFCRKPAMRKPDCSWSPGTGWCSTPTASWRP